MMEKFKKKFQRIWLLGLLLNCPLWAAPNSVQFQGGGSFKPVLASESPRGVGLPVDTRSWWENRVRANGNMSFSGFYLETGLEATAMYRASAAPTFVNPAATSFWDANYQLHAQDQTELRARVDRLFLQWSDERFEVKVGKQVVPVGVGRVFTAVSQTPRASFVRIDSEYEPTVDAASVTAQVGVPLEARIFPRPNGEDADFHFRVKPQGNSGEGAVTLGKSDQKAYVGLEGSTSVGDSVLRAELAGYQDRDKVVAQSLLGWDLEWTGRLGTTLEVFYNGFGQSGDYEIATPRHRPVSYLGQVYAGGSIRYEWTALLKTESQWVTNLADRSFLVSLAVFYSLSDNLDLQLAHRQNLGTAKSEFGGTLPIQNGGGLRVGGSDLTYLLLRYSF